MENKGIEHSGVLGMKWGQRQDKLVTTVRGKSTLTKTTVRGKPITKLELLEKNPSVRSTHQKTLDQRKTERAKKYLEKERAYERLGIEEGKRLPNNWKKRMTEIDSKSSGTTKQRVAAALILIGTIAIAKKAFS
jgi:hypothetical protein